MCVPVRLCRRGHRVKLHIYDVSRDPLVHHLNQLLAHQGAPVKLGVEQIFAMSCLRWHLPRWSCN